MKPNIDHLNGMVRPRWRGRLHAAGVVAVAPSGCAVAVLANGMAAVGVFVTYLVGLLATLTVSASYHLVARTRRAQEWMQRADHSTIFLLIAGTYTPVCYLVVPAPWSTVLLVSVWVVAAVGMVLKLCRRAWRAGTVLYLVIGWSALVLLPAVWSQHGFLVAGPLAGGGLLYTLGAVLFLTGRPRRHSAVFGHHEIWHAFTLAAAILHFFAVVALLAGTGHL